MLNVFPSQRPGLAGNYQSWGPQVYGLCGTNLNHEEEDLEASSRGSDDDCSERKELISKDDRSSEYGCTRDSTGNGVEVVTFDNRGVGNSSIPRQKSAYS
jgi:hypothetical protein